MWKTKAITKVMIIKCNIGIRSRMLVKNISITLVGVEFRHFPLYGLRWNSGIREGVGAAFVHLVYIK